MSLLNIVSSLLNKTLVPLNNLTLKKNPNETLFITQLRKRVKEVPLNKQTKLAHDQWSKNIATLRNQILKKNPMSFLQWDIIRNTMFIGNAIFTLKEFNYLRKHHWKKWKEAIVEKRYIPTEPYLLYPKSSGNLVHQSYHLAQFESMSGKKIKDFDFIFEYGGGYGSMCQLVHNLGFNGKYIIFDFPVFLAIQAFFLKMNGLEVNENRVNGKNEQSSSPSKIFCLDSLKMVKKAFPKNGKGLFIATWSLSESPLKIRRQIYPIIKNMDFHLIAYQARFNEIDNQKYLKAYRSKFNKIKWREWEITQLRNHFYLFGFPNSSL